MTRARPTILEPIMNVEVYAPSDFAGDLMGDLNGRRGRIAGMDTRGATTIIKAQVPMSEMLTYEQHLTSATGGRGSYHMEYSHYDEVPAHLQTKIIAAAKAERAGVEVRRSLSRPDLPCVGSRFDSCCRRTRPRLAPDPRSGAFCGASDVLFSSCRGAVRAAARRASADAFGLGGFGASAVALSVLRASDRTRCRRARPARPRRCRPCGSRCRSRRV